MDAQRRDEMTDAALDAELQAMLAVDPSPAFAGRVRVQIANRPSRAWFTGRALAVPLAAVAAVVTVAVAVYRASPRPADDRTNLAPPPIAAHALVRSPGSLAIGLSGRDVRGVHATARAGESRPLATAEPEVLVDPREAAALRAFFARARSGDVALAAILAPAATPLASSNDFHDIYIAPIAFEPVSGATEDKGVRQ